MFFLSIYSISILFPYQFSAFKESFSLDNELHGIALVNVN